MIPITVPYWTFSFPFAQKSLKLTPHFRFRASQPGLTEDALIGTTAEIYEFREPSPTSLEVGLKIKAKGRQRFRILNSRRQIDG